ncbi:MAG: hypothetical protein IT376_03105 [Polyangiaceae bacterium]|nr:hypothetical protein [Polyangiaceae bacterium]
MRPALRPVLVAAAAVFASFGCGSCRRTRPPEAAPPPPPAIRLFVLGGVAGALEPCGCQKDMLGGLDHVAALVRARGGEAAGWATVAAGPQFFMEPRLEPARRQQDEWKAGAIADALRAIELRAWAPGMNDWAAGGVALGELRERSGGVALAANLTAAPALEGVRIAEVGGVKVGFVGLSLPRSPLGSPDGVAIAEARPALGRGIAELEERGARVRVALLAMPRGEALRLAEAEPTLDLVVIGKPWDKGEGNDAPTPAVLVGSTLVVEPPNHAQAVAIVDLHLRGPGPLADGHGLEAGERRASLERRIAELEQRLATSADPASGARAEDVAARRVDLERARAELGGLPAGSPPAAGNYFRYELALVREAAGVDPTVAAAMGTLYRRINEHNREAFRDRKPAEVPAGESGFVGVERCATCHASAVEFWRRTPHSRAYATLESQHKQFNLECVGCHVTGYDRPGGSTVTHVAGLEAVQCENCHGPGSRHVGNPGSSAYITRRPAENLCAGQCHHSPHVLPDWNAADALRKVVGPGHGG